jgi:hypothetical protein
MNTQSLLDQCLAFLQHIKDDRQSLERLLEFMEEEFVEEDDFDLSEIPDYKLEILEKYRTVVKTIAENIEMGFVSYVNLETLEIDATVTDEEYRETEDFYQFPKWEDKIEIEPLESRESFEIMENFVNYLPACKEKNRLSDAISGYKPFANFNRLIHDSDYRENWFEFRTKLLEKYVIDNYLGEIIKER